MYFGIKNRADFRAIDIQYGEGGMRFTLKFNNSKLPIFIPGYGDHQVANALAALAAVNEIGINMNKQQTV